MEETIIKGDIFIIPNPSTEFSKFGVNQENLVAKTNRLLGLEIKPDDRMVQIWVTSPECDNWCCHFGGIQRMLGMDYPTNLRKLELSEDDLKEKRLLGFFPEYLPKRVFQEKKEGDKVQFSCPEYGCTIELTLSQLKYRYYHRGPFEKAIETV